MLEGIALQYLPDKSQIDLEQAFQAVNQMMIHWLQGDCAGYDRQVQVGTGRPRRKPYPTDLNEAQWSQVAPLLNPAKEGGRPRSTDLREIVNALLYALSCGCPWRMLPHDFPGWQTVYAYYRLWNTDGTLEKIGAAIGVDFCKKGKTCEQA